MFSAYYPCPYYLDQNSNFSKKLNELLMQKHARIFEQLDQKRRQRWLALLGNKLIQDLATSDSNNGVRTKFTIFGWLSSFFDASTATNTATSETSLTLDFQNLLAIHKTEELPEHKQTESVRRWPRFGYRSVSQNSVARRNLKHRIEQTLAAIKPKKPSFFSRMVFGDKAYQEKLRIYNTAKDRIETMVITELATSQHDFDDIRDGLSDKLNVKLSNEGNVQSVDATRIPASKKVRDFFDEKLPCLQLNINEESLSHDDSYGNTYVFTKEELTELYWIAPRSERRRRENFTQDQWDILNNDGYTYIHTKDQCAFQKTYPKAHTIHIVEGKLAIVLQVEEEPIDDLPERIKESFSMIAQLSSCKIYLYLSPEVRLDLSEFSLGTEPFQYQRFSVEVLVSHIEFMKGRSWNVLEKNDFVQRLFNRLIRLKHAFDLYVKGVCRELTTLPTFYALLELELCYQKEPEAQPDSKLKDFYESVLLSQESPILSSQLKKNASKALQDIYEEFSRLTNMRWDSTNLALELAKSNVHTAMRNHVLYLLEINGYEAMCELVKKHMDSVDGHIFKKITSIHQEIQAEQLSASAVEEVKPAAAASDASSEKEGRVPLAHNQSGTFGKGKPKSKSGFNLQALCIIGNYR